MRIVDGSGTNVAKYRYDPYGNLVSSSGTMAANNPLRYRGYYFDSETGFYYLQSRYYDPEIARFINADDFASTGQGILGHNMFAYCNNNPIMYVDFHGNKPEVATEEDRYRFVGIGFQGELDVGGYEVGFEIIVYYDELVCGVKEPMVAVYLYEGAFVDNEDIMNSGKYLQTVEKLTLAIMTNAIDEQNAEALLISLQAVLFKDVGVSGSVVGIFGNQYFNTTESYSGSFTTYSATVNHVKVSVSTCSSCFSIAVGASTDRFGASFGQSYYTQVY